MLRYIVRGSAGRAHTRVSRPNFGFLQARPRSYASAPDPRPSDNNSAAQARADDVSKALKSTEPSNNNLLSPVHIPEDPHGVIKERHPATSILANSAIVIQRELEMMNIMMGFEQANKYVIHDPQGNHIGYMAEQELGIGNAMGRQFLTTHRPFTTHVFDRSMKEVLRFHRPFSWISSRIKVFDPVEISSSSLSPSTSLETTQPGHVSPHLSDASPNISPLAMSDMRIIGEAQQQWAPLRRKYNLFLLRDPPPADPSSPPSPSMEPSFDQFAYVDERFLSWDFSLLSSSNALLGSVNRNFTNFGREIFTDAGCYALRMDAAALAEEPRHLISKTGQLPTGYGEGKRGMSLDQRAVMLATAVSVDFDYFSPSRRGMFGGMWPMYMGGAAPVEAGAGAAGAGAGAAGAEGAAGAGEVTAAGAAGGLARTGAAGQAGEGAVAGAGSMAAYEAMQGRMGRTEQGAQGGADEASPVSNDPYGSTQGQDQGQQEEVWGEEFDWGQQPKGGSSGSQGGDIGGGGDGGGGGGGDGGWFDLF